MSPEEIIKRLGVFVLVLVVVVGAFAAAPMAQSGDTDRTTSTTSVTVDSFQPDSILASAGTDSGQITMSADGTDKTVLIDMAHENDVSQEQLGPIVRTLVENGAEVEFVTRDQARGEAFNKTLRNADAFVAISPARSYTADQKAGLSAFAEAGGRVVLMQEPMQMSLGGFFIYPPEETSPAPMAGLASEFGLAFGNGYLYNMQENDNNYRQIYATPSGGSELTEGVDRVVIREGTQVQGGTPVLTGLEQTTLSTTRSQGTYPIAATNGNVTAVGDTTFFTETGYQDGDNEVLTGQLLDFLVSGEKVPGVPGDTEPEQPTGTTGGQEQPPEPPEPPQ